MAQTLIDISAVQGDNLDIIRTIRDVPASQVLTDAWLTVKAHVTDADLAAVLQKHITVTYVQGLGNITDTGADGTGAVLFEITPTETAALTPRHDYVYDIQVKTDAGIYATPFGGYIRLVADVTKTVV